MYACAVATSIDFVIRPLSLFRKNKSRLMRSPCCVCACVCPISAFECLNQSLWKLVCTSWTWANLNGVLHKSLTSVCVCMCIPPIVARQRLDKHVAATRNCWRCRFLCGVCVVSYQAINSFQNFLFIVHLTAMSGAQTMKDQDLRISLM
jgi:hypothetical protein